MWDKPRRDSNLKKKTVNENLAGYDKQQPRSIHLQEQGREKCAEQRPQRSAQRSHSRQICQSDRHQKKKG